MAAESRFYYHTDESIHCFTFKTITSASQRRGEKCSGPELLSIEELFTILLLEYCDFIFCFIHINMHVFLSGLLLLVLTENFFLVVLSLELVESKVLKFLNFVN